MVADRKVWPDARTGAKGQRPTHGRAGAGLASSAGTGAGADPIVLHNDSGPIFSHLLFANFAPVSEILKIMNISNPRDGPQSIKFVVIVRV